MHDVASAWLITTQADRVVIVARVRAASTLPAFVLGLPSGTLADIVHRHQRAQRVTYSSRQVAHAGAVFVPASALP